MKLKSTSLSPFERVTIMVGAVSSVVLLVWQGVTTHAI